MVTYDSKSDLPLEVHYYIVVLVFLAAAPRPNNYRPIARSKSIGGVRTLFEPKTCFHNAWEALDPPAWRCEVIPLN